MKYLFFDIECSNCFGGINKMCEFGYAVFKDQLEYAYKLDIPMSPGKGRENRFDNSIYRRDSSFRWAYEYDYYYSCDEFPSFYYQIKKVLENKEFFVFGYAVDNDIRYLSDACKRYKKEMFDFDVIDVSKLSQYDKYKNEKKHGLQGSFEKIYGKMEIANLDCHLSCDDAYMTAMILKKIMLDNNATLEQIIKDNPNAKLNAKEYIEQLNKRKKQKEENAKKNEILYMMMKHDKKKDKGNLIDNNVLRFSFSGKVKNHVDEAIEMAKYIIDNNCELYRATSLSEYLIYYDEDDKAEIGTQLDVSKLKLITMDEAKNIIKEYSKVVS